MVLGAALKWVDKFWELTLVGKRGQNVGDGGVSGGAGRSTFLKFNSLDGTAALYK